MALDVWPSAQLVRATSWVPGWTRFRNQERAAYGVVFGLSCLAGFGLRLLLATPTDRLHRWAGIWSLVVLLGIVGFGRFWQLPGRGTVSWPEFWLTTAATVAGLLAMALVLGVERWRPRFPLLLTTPVTAGLFLANGATGREPRPPDLQAALEARRGGAGRRTAALRASPAPLCSRDDGDPRPGLQRVSGRGRLWHDGQPGGAVGHQPPRLARYARLFEKFPLDRLWSLGGVEHLLTWRRELFEPSLLLAKFPAADGTTYLHRLLEPNPRAWFVQELVVADDLAAALLADHSFDLETQAIVPPGMEYGTLIAGSATPSAPLRLRRGAQPGLRVELTGAEAGFLVLSEN